MADTVFAKSGGSSGKSDIIVTAQTGSTVTCSNGSDVKTAPEKDGTWTFRGCGIGTWTVTASLDGQTATATVEITEKDQRMRYYVSISYQLHPSDFEFYLDENKTTPATLGTHYQIVDDSENDIPQSEWASAENWKARILTSLWCVPLKDGNIDIFLAGGGGGGCGGYSGKYEGPGGGGGYTQTVPGYPVTAGSLYHIVIGAGGAATQGSSGSAGDGGETSAFGESAAGGKGAYGSTSGCRGGNGGSGGSVNSGAGGTDGSDGAGSSGANVAGTGQHTTTREFGENGATLYSTGGSFGGSKTVIPDDNTGDGGNGGNSYSGNAVQTKGASGIVVFRNGRERA